MPREVYFDSCMFLYWLAKTEGFHEAVDGLIGQADRGNLVIAISDIAYTEILEVPGVRGVDGGWRAIDTLFSQEWLVMLASSTAIMQTAGQVRREHGLNAPDSIHVATAAAYRIPLLYTFDEAMLDKDEIQTSLGSVRIERPPQPNRRTANG